LAAPPPRPRRSSPLRTLEPPEESAKHFPRIYNAHLRWTQWLGVATILAVVTLLPTRPRRKVVELPPVDARLEAAPA